MTLDSLEGRKIGEFYIHIGTVKKGRFAGESTFQLFIRDKKNQISSDSVAIVRHFAGSKQIKPWMEIGYSEKVKIGENTVELTKNKMDASFFKTLSMLIPPGGHIMVKYLDHPITSMALTAGVPPPATPIGYLLWKSGFRWFKDWYFPEGGLEGEPKLQANKPLNEAVEKERVTETSAELNEFLRNSKGEAEFEKISRKNALNILEEIEELSAISE